MTDPPADPAPAPPDAAPPPASTEAHDLASSTAVTATAAASGAAEAATTGTVAASGAAEAATTGTVAADTASDDGAAAVVAADGSATTSEDAADSASAADSATAAAGDLPARRDDLVSPEDLAAEKPVRISGSGDGTPRGTAVRVDRRRRRRRSSLIGRVSLIACALVAAAVGVALVVQGWVGDPVIAGAVTLAVLVPATLWAVRGPLSPVMAMFRALSGTVTSYRDGDFAFSLAWPHNDELGDLVAAHNALGDTLRGQRGALIQRELLLDTMVQNTPVAMLLCDPAGRIVYGNLSARQLVGGGRRLEGQRLDALLEAAPEALREAIARGGDGLFVVERDDEEEIYYLARSGFRLNGRPHELFVLRHLTAVLHRQEVRTWKKVIRVISHELNNSLAPVASLAHSGRELVRLGKHDQLEKVFSTIAERARHLEQFIQGYARFAKLPAPRPEPIAWPELIERLRSQIVFQVDGPLPDARARVDPAQLEQALVNLLSNAHESESPAADIHLRVRRLPAAVAIEVSDRGTGMNAAVLSNALLPFYSTKRGGTGLGLALVREIAEAHGGRVSLANRAGGGVSVTITIPQ